MANDKLSLIWDKVDKSSNHETEINELRDENDKLPGIYLFISIDLVDSTIFKTRFTHYWPFVIQSFYRIVTRALGTDNSYRENNQIKYVGKKEDYEKEKVKTGGYKVWKLVGDEVLIYHKIVSKKEVLNTIRILQHLTRNIIDLFETQANERLSGEELDEFRKIARRHLAAKTTVWAAKCGDVINLKYPNMYYDSSNYIDSLESCLDFLGPDIDAGFRLCKYAEKNKVIISPNLVALLTASNNASNEDSELEHEINSFRIVAYLELEDIWEKRLYPIFMYLPSSKPNADISDWKALFEYDEWKSSRLTEYIFHDSQNFLGTNGTKDFLPDKLENIYRDLGRYEEIEELKADFLKQIHALEKADTSIAAPRHRFEFHISCACYNSQAKKLWVQDHEYHGLSFGCIKIDMNHDYREKVIESYRNKYNLNITLSDDPQILSLYSVNRETKDEILGIIILAEGNPADNAKLTKDNGWYSFSGIEKMKKTKQKHIQEFYKVVEKIKNIVDNKIRYPSNQP